LKYEALRHYEEGPDSPFAAFLAAAYKGDEEPLRRMLAAIDSLNEAGDD